MNDKSIDNGGLVSPLFREPEKGQWYVKRGITLRNHYAGLAMQGMLSNYGITTKAFKAIPELAYRMADAIIAEGRKNE